MMLCAGNVVCWISCATKNMENNSRVKGGWGVHIYNPDDVRVAQGSLKKSGDVLRHSCYNN